jgi:hypothetical protein
MPLLSNQEFALTFQEPMHRLPPEAEPAFDFWPYFDSIPDGDFRGHDCSDGQVDYVYRHPQGRLEHVLVNSSTPDIFMVLVLDQLTKTVVGHHLLDLPKLYGLSD